MSIGADRGQSSLLRCGCFGILPWEPWLERWKKDLAGVFWILEEEENLDDDDPALGRTPRFSWLSTWCKASRSLPSRAGRFCSFR